MIAPVDGFVTASPFFTMLCSSVKTVLPVGLLKAAAVARPVRPLLLFTKSELFTPCQHLEVPRVDREGHAVGVLGLLERRGVASPSSAMVVGADLIFALAKAFWL